MLSVLHEPNAQPRYLQKAPSLFYDWVGACSTEAAELQKRSEVSVVPHVLRVGPEVCPEENYKRHTVTSASVCRSHIPGHVAVFHVAASRSRRKSVRLNALRFRCQRHPCADLLPTYKVLQEYVMHNVVYPNVQALPLGQLQQAQTHGEWEIVSHDATFKKCCFPFSDKSRWHNGKMSTVPCTHQWAKLERCQVLLRSHQKESSTCAFQLMKF